MTGKTERGLCEFYADDAERADRLVFGRRAGADRRGFLRGAGLAAMGAVLGSAIPFHRNMPAGLIPAALAETTEAFVIEGKDGLTLLNDRPVNAETPAHLLDDAVTPSNRHFVRNNGLVNEAAMAGDADGWHLIVDGAVHTPLRLSMADLRERFDATTLQLQLECGGNGRAAFNPPARGNQWTVGAIGCAEWTGVRVRDVLAAAGLRSNAVYTGYYGSDLHLSGAADRVPISRGAPIAKMTEEHTILAFAMNGEDLPALHGFPMRIVAPGWPGSVSGKWLDRIVVRDQVHDGPKMGGHSYRVPWYPPAPGEEVADEDWRIIESMPVKSLITAPRHNTVMDSGVFEVRGHAWAGDRAVAAVDLSIDFGASWTGTVLDPPANRYAWQNWRADVSLPSQGYFEIWARARDDQGRMQPFAVTWNSKGYLNNSMHRVAVVLNG